jgi:hypothetical protein
MDANSTGFLTSGKAFGESNWQKGDLPLWTQDASAPVIKVVEI